MLRINQLTGFSAFTAGGGGAVDPNFSSVVFLAGFEGTNGSTGAPALTDESTTNNKGTGGLQAAGSSVTTAQFRYGASALDLTASGGWDWADSVDFDFGSGLFTVEASFRPDIVTAGVRAICGQWNSVGNAGWSLAQSAATLIWRVSTNGTNSFTDLTSSSILVNGTWTDAAVDFDGTTYRLYIDGAVVATSTTLRTLFNSSLNFSIGHSYGSGGTLAEKLDGTIDEVRVTKGVARYAGVGYTPAAFPRS